MSRGTSSANRGSLYDAFISYSHAADGLLAPRIQASLQNFAKPWFVLRTLRVFRDRTTLAVTPELWPEIASALNRSRYLVLICSPEAAASEWVRAEVRLWLDLKRERRLLLVWTDGTLVWDRTDFDWTRTNALPVTLRAAYSQVPNYLDLRWARNPDQLSMRRPEFIECIARLAAAIHEKPLDEIFGEEIRQHRRTKIMAVSAAAVLLTATVFAILGWKGEIDARHMAERQTRIATAQRYAAESKTLATQSPQESVLRAVQSIETTRSQNEPVLALAEEALRDSVANIEGRSLRGHAGPVYCVAISPDGTRLATGGADGLVRLWDYTTEDSTMTPLLLEGHAGSIRAIAFASDGRWLIVANEGAPTRVWDLKAGKKSDAVRVLAENSSEDLVVACSPDGHRFATGSASGSTWLWTLNDTGPNSPIELLGHQKLVGALAFAADASNLLTGSNDNTARVWNIASGNLHPVSTLLTTHASFLSSVILSARWIVTASSDTTIRVWARDKNTGAVNPSELRGHADRVASIALSPNERWLLSGGEDEKALLWDLSAADPAAKPIDLTGHSGGIVATAFTPDNRWAFTASRDGTIRQWNLFNPRSGMASKILHGHEGAVFSLAVSPDGRWLASGSFDQTARIWEIHPRIRAGKSAIFRGHTSYTKATITSDNRQLISGSWKGPAKIWGLSDPEPELSPIILSPTSSGSNNFVTSDDNRWLLLGDQTGMLRIHALQESGVPQVSTLKISDKSVTALAYDPVNERFAIGSTDSVHILKVSPQGDLQVQQRLEHAHLGSTVALGFSPNGRWVATSGDREANFKLWDLDVQGRSPTPIQIEHESYVPEIAFSPDGKWLAVGSGERNGLLLLLGKDGSVRKRSILTGHLGQILSVKISRDSRWLATASRDDTVRLWDLASDDPSATSLVLSGHTDDAMVIEFSPDSRFLVSGSLDRTVRRWNVMDAPEIRPPLTLRGAEAGITSLSIESHGRWIVAADYRGNVILWPLLLSDVLAAARFVAGEKASTAGP